MPDWFIKAMECLFSEDFLKLMSVIWSWSFFLSALFVFFSWISQNSLEFFVTWSFLAFVIYPIVFFFCYLYKSRRNRYFLGLITVLFSLAFRFYLNYLMSFFFKWWAVNQLVYLAIQSSLLFITLFFIYLFYRICKWITTKPPKD